MLLVNVSVKPSPIHGLGCFANEPIARGQIVWTYDERIDRRIPAEQVPELPRLTQDFLKVYGYAEMINGRKLITVCGDNARFINHSSEPNISANEPGTGNDVAARDIAAGEELTEDYYRFDVDIERRWLET